MSIKDEMNKEMGRPPAVATKERLALELEKYGCPPEMVQRARAGYYDDFESELPAPIYELVTDLRALNKHALAKRAMEGEFDSTKEEADAWMKREGMGLLREGIDVQ
jgi:hypothetical protein